MKRARITSVFLVAVIATVWGPAPGASAATQPNAGEAAFSGQVRFAGHGISPLNTPCRPASFTFSAEATISLANGAGSQGAWVLAPPFGALLTGSGLSTCENVLVGGGLVSFNAIDVVNPVTAARLRCTGMSGAYTRQLADLAAVLGGSCAIDSFDAGKVTLYVKANFAPSGGTGNGVTTNVTAASLNGTFTVVPA